jgi:hypothetical protein
MDTNLLLLALEDFLPVVLSAAALWVLSRMCGRLDAAAGRFITASLVLLAIGGLTKPIYKTLLALSDGSIDILVLDDLLFWFLAPGFLLLAAGLIRGSRADRALAPRAGRGWIAAAVSVVLASAALLAVGSDAWFVVLLATATVGNVITVVVLVRWASRRADVFTAALFAAILVIVFGLAWAASSLEQTIPTQWAEQLFSTASQGLLLWGSVRLSGAVTARLDAPAVAVQDTGTPRLG